jgi:carbonic anhydrase/acetyltransferase-like protein (isoleucine patch superfamily)
MHGMLNQWPVVVGDWVTVGHSVTLHGCVVEDRCLIGMGVIILNGARIGAGSIIAAGTLIPEETVIPPGSLVMGVPGKVRKELSDDDQQTILRYAKNYLGYKETYLAERKK